MASRAATIKVIREEYLRETDHDPGAAGASVILDQQCEGFFHRWVGYEPEMRPALVRDEWTTAQYLMWAWTGDDGRALRAVIAEVEAREAEKA